jgi:predicted TPR repeat methyltransferase/thioredoxin-like negative regulator of GroEL
LIIPKEKNLDMNAAPLSPSDLLSKAFNAQQANKPIKASNLFRKVLKMEANNIDALHGLGLCYAQRKLYDKAIKWITKAIKLAPHIPAFHNNLGNLYKKIRQTSLALQHYREALRLKTPYPDAHNNLGALLYEMGNIKEATEELERAVQSAPETINAHYNLACCYAKQDRFQDALIHYLIVLKKQSDHLGALHNAGILLTELKRYDEAKGFLSQALSRNPGNIDLLFHLAIIHSAEAEYYNAKVLYERIIEQNPNHAAAYHNLATVLLHLNQRFQALDYFKKAYQLQPENFTAKHMIDAITENPETKQTPPNFIQALFDQYAYNYNDHVKTQLKYQVPSLIREALSPYANQDTLYQKILDLGCGTGLMAPYLSDICMKLIGVDLSENMIEMAKRLGAYYKLYHDNILHFLPKHLNEFDLIVAADVLCYFGDLKEILIYCQHALMADCLLVFTVEYLNNPAKKNQPYRLQTSGRFVHSETYIENQLKEAGFTLETCKQVILRYQEDIPVDGLLFIVRKTNA